MPEHVRATFPRCSTSAQGDARCRRCSVPPPKARLRAQTVVWMPGSCSRALRCSCRKSTRKRCTHTADGAHSWSCNTHGRRRCRPQHDRASDGLDAGRQYRWELLYVVGPQPSVRSGPRSQGFRLFPERYLHLGAGWQQRMSEGPDVKSVGGTFIEHCSSVTRGMLLPLGTVL